MINRAVLVTGATGQIGRFLLPRLAGKGHTVLAVSRRGPPAAYPQFQGVVWRRPGEVKDNAQALVSCGPLAVALERLRFGPSIQRIVAFSSTSVIAKQDSGDARERDVVTSLGEAEARLGEACAAGDVGLTLLRPTLVYGAGMDANITLLARLIEQFGFMPVAGAASGLRQPVHAEDLALAADAALDADESIGRTIDLPGGTTLTYRLMVIAVARALGRSPRIIRLPPPLLRAAVRLLRLWPGLSALSPELVDRQNRDLVFDVAEAQRLLGYTPRSFDPLGSDFHPPEPQRLRQTFLGTPAV